MTENEDELSLDRKMIAVVVKLILRLCRTFCLGYYASMRLISKMKACQPLWSQLGKFDLETSLWAYLCEGFGYTVEEPTFSDLVLKLFCTEFWSQIEGVERYWLLNNVLKAHQAGRQPWRLW